MNRLVTTAMFASATLCLCAAARDQKDDFIAVVGPDTNGLPPLARAGEYSRRGFIVAGSDWRGIGWPGGGVRFIRLRYNGPGWDDGMSESSGADSNLLEAFENLTGWNGRGMAQQIGMLKRYPKGYEPPFVYMTGSGSISVDDRQKQILRDYLLKGGMLLADCGSPEWDKAFRSFIHAVLPEKALLDIGDDDLLFGVPYALPRGAAPRLQNGGPRALGMRHHGRLCVFYHPGDLNEAWKTDRGGRGAEEAKRAFELGINIIYYAHVHNMPATNPYKRAFLTLLAPHSIPLRAHPPPSTGAGALALDLLCISDNTATNRPVFRLSVTNTSNLAFAVSLGRLYPGRKNFPAISLVFITETGDELRLVSNRNAAVGLMGRPPDLMILVLDQGESYSFEIDFDNFWFRTRPFRLSELPAHYDFHRTGLPSGKYQVHAELSGLCPQATEKDAPKPYTGWNFWKGSAKSNTLNLQLE